MLWCECNIEKECSVLFWYLFTVIITDGQFRVHSNKHAAAVRWLAMVAVSILQL